MNLSERETRVLPSVFFDRPTVEVAQDLLGRWLCTADGVVLEIIETEAYCANDSACHASRGRTPRTAPLFGPPGCMYVYLCYGIHRLLNLVTEAEGTIGCVLIRGAVVVAGHSVVKARRGDRLDTIGPGKVGQALALDLSWSGLPLDGTLPPRTLAVAEGRTNPGWTAHPRVGIDYADPVDRARLWRFCAEAPPSPAPRPRTGKARR